MKRQGGRQEVLTEACESGSGGRTGVRAKREKLEGNGISKNTRGLVKTAKKEVRQPYSQKNPKNTHSLLPLEKKNGHRIRLPDATSTHQAAIAKTHLREYTGITRQENYW